MRLSKADILQAIMVGLTLLASAIAVPMIVSAQNAQSAAQNLQEIQQAASETQPLLQEGKVLQEQF